MLHKRGGQLFLAHEQRVQRISGYPCRRVVRVISCSQATSLRSAYDFIRAQILYALLANELVAFGAKVINLELGIKPKVVLSRVIFRQFQLTSETVALQLLAGRHPNV